MRSTVAAVALLLFCFCVNAWAQQSPTQAEADSLRSRGQTFLSKARWSEAVGVFKDLATRFAHSPDLDYYLLCEGKGEYYGGNTAVALGTFDRLIARFPESPYTPTAQYFGACAQYKANQRDKALTRFVEAFARSYDERLDRLIVLSLAAYDPGKLEASVSNASLGLSVKRRCDLAKGLAERFVQRGRTQEADRLRALCGSSKETATMSSTADIGEVCDLAVLVPLSGEYQTFGQDLYDGAATAAAAYRKETGKQITLTPYDTKGDPIVAARLVRELVSLPVDALIGPLTSDEAEVVSASLGCHTLPMIAPAATEAGITELSDCSFQLCPNVALEGAQMAEYARNMLHADTAVVISSNASDQLQISQEFIKRFEALGGKVVATEYYRSRDHDFGQYINDIKSVLLGRSADSATFLDDKGDTLNSEATPAQVDCIFMPGVPDQIRLLLPQVRYYNLSGAYLGSDGWGDESVYALGEDVTRGAVFPSPFIRVARSQGYGRFVSAFNESYNRKPTRVAGLGYDAVRVLTEALKRGASTRQLLLDQLSATHGYDGVEGRVTFGSRRENIEMPIYKIVSGQAEPVSVGGPTSK
jgi:branched-chain amino acid transport system substrate-binding protein